MLNRPVSRLLPDVPEFDVTVIPPAPSAPRGPAAESVSYQRSHEDLRAEVAGRVLQALITAQGPNLSAERAVVMAISYTDALLKALK